MNLTSFENLFSVPSRNGLTKPKRVRGSGCKMVNMGELFAHSRIDNIEMDRVPLNDKEKEVSLLNAKDLLFARQSLVLSGAGQCSIFIGDFEDVCFESHLIRCRLDNTKADPHYYFYFFKSPRGRNTIEAIVEQGAGASGIRGKDLGKVMVPHPPLFEQKRIAAVLGALDDKIELNRKMNKMLEAVAQAIFKSWFVDFEHFRDGGMVDSELGPIPKGWKVGTVGDIASNYRQTVKPEEQEKGTPYIGLADMPMRCIALDSWGEAGDATSAKARYQSGDILFGKLRPYFKKVGVAPTDGVCSSDILVVRPKQEMWFGYTLGILTYDAFIDFTSTVSTGTRMPRVNWKAMSDYKLPLPPIELAEKYNALIATSVQRIHSNVLENRTLGEVRDALLPKLISGEVRVPEVPVED